MKLNEGLIKRDRHFSWGNGTLLVVVDSAGAYWNRVIVDETILVALEHFGLPYRLLDLAVARPTPTELINCAGIILAQNQLSEALTELETRLLADAVNEGVGLVNFDNDLRFYKPPFLEIFGFEQISPYPFATNLLRITESDHYITQMQMPGEWHQFDKMVTAVIIERRRKDVAVLAEGVLGKDQLVFIRHLAPGSSFVPKNYPLLFATPWGKGRAVQFAINPRVWRNVFFGHGRGIDDLFWRSIVWSVRKPFVANMIPPFITMSIDDCRGGHDFAYAEIAEKHGFFPMPSLFLKEVPERLFPKIRKGFTRGKIRYNTHALSYNELFIYHFGRFERTREELEKLFAFDDAFWGQVGAEPSITNRFHWGEYGQRALPFLKERGRVFFCPALQMGLHKADMCMTDGYWPYNTQTCYYDYLPDDHDFFAFMSTAVRGQEDFLTGCTVNLRECDGNDVEKAARSAAKFIQHGLRGGFFAELITHEQKIDVLSVADWDQILSRALQFTNKVEKIFASHDEIGNYLKAKDGVWFSNVTANANAVNYTLNGRTKIPLKLSVFRNADYGVIREFESG